MAVRVMRFEYTEEDERLLYNKFPTLKYNVKEHCINGIFVFDAEYGNPVVRIADSYSIMIDLNRTKNGVFPIIKETKGKIMRIAKRKKIPVIDLHYENDDALCLMHELVAKDIFKNGYNLEQLLVHLRNFCYWVSYYNRYNKEPWVGLKHMEAGTKQLKAEHLKYVEGACRQERKRIQQSIRNEIKEKA